MRNPCFAFVGVTFCEPPGGDRATNFSGRAICSRGLPILGHPNYCFAKSHNMLKRIRAICLPLLIGAMLPLAVLLCFIAMKVFGVDANIVALSGIAIAIGTIVDMGIVLCENILRHLDDSDPHTPRSEVIHRATSEVGGAVTTAVATTVISFLPVFTMVGQEGKLFRPLAFTKTFVLVASIALEKTKPPN